MDFKIGARDWCYVLENAGSLTKGQFDAAEKLIGDCRKDGHLPLDICAIDKGRPTANVESIDTTSVEEEAADIVERIEDAHLAYEPFSFWENQKYYVETAVEKIGLFNLFEEPTADFHVPLTNLGGWSDINSRAEIMRRFAYWERRGKRCVLLVCNDHDPGRFNISDFIKSNLDDLEGAVGWSPENLKVDRFGLNTGFIHRHRLSWIPEFGDGKRRRSQQKEPSRPLQAIRTKLSQAIRRTEGRGERTDCPTRSRSPSLPSGHPEIRLAVGGRCVSPSSLRRTTQGAGRSPPPVAERCAMNDVLACGRSWSRNSARTMHRDQAQPDAQHHRAHSATGKHRSTRRCASKVRSITLMDVEARHPAAANVAGCWFVIPLKAGRRRKRDGNRPQD